MVFENQHYMFITQGSVLQYLSSLQEWNSVLEKPIAEWLPAKKLSGPGAEVIKVDSKFTVLQGNNI
jgi:hypothetical protein